MVEDQNLLFRATLSPQRSASRRLRNTVIGIFAGASIPVGIAFAVLGAWPATAFIGFDIVLLAAFLHFHHFAGRAREIIEISNTALIIEQRDHWGRKKIWNFEPRWLRVHLEDIDEHHNHLEIRNRSCRLPIGSFLSTDEKAGLAATLRNALSQVSVLHAR